jgi:hypothetical protein
VRRPSRKGKFRTKQRANEIRACTIPKVCPKNGGSENGTDTGIYISEKQVYEANGIRPDSYDE